MGRLRHSGGGSVGGPAKAMTHPLRAHIRTLELRRVQLCNELEREPDQGRRLPIADRVRAIDWVLKFYRAGLDLEEQLLARLERQDRIEQLKRARDELRTQLSSGDCEAATVRKRMVEIAEQISHLETDA